MNKCYECEGLGFIPYDETWDVEGSYPGNSKTQYAEELVETVKEYVYGHCISQRSWLEPGEFSTICIGCEGTGRE